MKRLLIWVFVFLFFCSACSLQEDPRALASNKMNLTYDGEKCQPYESFVPLGEEIEITINNMSEFDITWYVIFHNLEGEFDDQDPENILISIQAPAQETTVQNFKSPYLSGKYSSYCVQNDDTTKLALTFLLVVEPYEEID